MRVAIVMPTIGEDISRAIESIDAQQMLDGASLEDAGIELHHVIVYDGEEGVTRVSGRRTWLYSPGERYGCGAVARAMGAGHAVDRLRCHALGFLDADCWLHPHHVATMIAFASQYPSFPALIAKRVIVTHDTGEPIEDHEPDRSGQSRMGPGGTIQPFVDTSCIWLQGRGVTLGPNWATAMRYHDDDYDADAPVNGIEDISFWGHVLNCLDYTEKPAPIASVPTVYYPSRWLSSYKPGGRQRPPEVARIVNANNRVVNLRWRVVSDTDGELHFQAWPHDGPAEPVPDGMTEVPECSR